MNKKKNLKINIIKGNKPTCTGVGLLALDIVLNGDKKKLSKTFAGGSCGNVLSILSFLGWNSYPIARFSNTLATDEIMSDLYKWKVKDDLINIHETGSTPIIIHRILKDKEHNIKHRFEFKIPGTTKWFPGYKSVLKLQVPGIIDLRESSNVFYFDRVSRAAIDLAKHYKESGSLVFFEPSSYKEDKQFVEAILLADIIKFSSDRMRNYSEKFPEKQAFIEIETLGSEGLIYRTKKSNKYDWTFLPAIKLSKIADSVGAGDWCSSGIIHFLGRNGSHSLKNSTIDDIENALEFGQLLGAMNCLFEGARGLMYNLDVPSINAYFSRLQKKDENLIFYVEDRDFNSKKVSFSQLMATKK
ncbi:MAG: hypothetical protein ACR2KX_13965 [Chitinophagaceae bacterium]